jgi:hypothetical protein
LLEAPSSAEASGAGEDADDEVDTDEDADEAIETNERDRWIAFLSWIGVNRALRPVHFHDVEDDATGWLTTRDLAQPRGWAFERLGDTWTAFASALRERVAARKDAAEKMPYVYDAHDLDQIVPLVTATERDASGTLARALLEHPVRHWPFYAGFADCRLALVDKDKTPSQRSKPQRALAEELTTAGDNLWLHRLRRRAICPTSHGPRPPGVTWQRSPAFNVIIQTWPVPSPAGRLEHQSSQRPGTTLGRKAAPTLIPPTERRRRRRRATGRHAEAGARRGTQSSSTTGRPRMGRSHIRPWPGRRTRRDCAPSRG